MSKPEVSYAVGEELILESSNSGFSAGPGMPGPAEGGQREKRGLNNEAVPAKQIKRRRIFTAAYKKGIVEQLDACSQPGEVGALLRREGLYSSNVSTFRGQLAAGTLAEGASQRKKVASHDRAMVKQQDNRAMARLERENLRLRSIIEIQKKLCELLNLPTEDVPPRKEAFRSEQD